METYNCNFLTDERKILENTLLEVAIKLRNKIKESRNSFLLTESYCYLDNLKRPEPILDTLYGYIYDFDTSDILEREVKGFYVTNTGALLICMDISNIAYKEDDLKYTLDTKEEIWHLILNEEDALVASDTCNVLLTLLSISECIYQYFK